MSNSILVKYDPKELSNHNILRFYSERLNEEDLIDFINAIILRNGWNLATVLAKESDVSRINKIVTSEFNIVFSRWIDERLVFSQSLEERSGTNPYLTKVLKSEFTDYLIAIGNLGFPESTLIILDNFINHCYSKLFEKYLDSSLRFFFDKFDQSEIEIFYFSYLKNLFEDDQFNDNYKAFLNVFLINLSSSTGIFSCSTEFIESISIIQKRYSNYNDLKSIRIYFLIDMIKNRKLDISASPQRIKITDKYFSTYNSFNLFEISFLFFLKKFNYNFSSEVMEERINNMMSSFEIKFHLNNGIPFKEKIEGINFMVTNSELIIEYFLFCLIHIKEQLRLEKLQEFTTLIDKLREDFNEIPFFKKFNELQIIEGFKGGDRRGGVVIQLINIDENNFKPIEFNESDISFKFDDFKTGFLTKRQLELLDRPLERNDADVHKFFIQQYLPTNKGQKLILSPYRNPFYLNLNHIGLCGFMIQLELFILNYLSAIQDYPFPFTFFEKFYNTSLHPILIKKEALKLCDDEFLIFVKKYRPSYFKVLVDDWAARINQIQIFEELKDKNINVQGRIVQQVQGGFIVDVDGFNSFLPGSLVDISVRDGFSQYLGIQDEFEIVQINKETRNIVVSRKGILENQLKNTLAELDKGSIVEGTVKAIQHYGAFIDLGFVVGLIHITNFSYLKVKDINDYFDLGEKIRVVVIDIDLKRSRVELSVKELLEPKLFEIWKLYKPNSVYRLIIPRKSFTFKLENGFKGRVTSKKLLWQNLKLNQSVFDRVFSIYEWEVQCTGINFTYKTVYFQPHLTKNILLNNYLVLKNQLVSIKGLYVGLYNHQGFFMHDNSILICPAYHMSKLINSETLIPGISEIFLKVYRVKHETKETVILVRPE